MTKVQISETLFGEITKKFGMSQAHEIVDLCESLEKTPHKGKNLTSVDGILVKEIKYESFRFYFITDGHTLKFGTQEEVTDLLIKFVRMSKKKDQQKTINEIVAVLKSFGFEGY
jgi:hypothetical protein